MADDKTTRSKLSEKDHRKDTEDEELRANISGPKPKDTSKGKSKATTQAHENTEEEEEEEATKKKLKIGVGDTKGLERKTNKSVLGKGIADLSGVQIKSESEIPSETEMPMKTDAKLEGEGKELDDYVEVETNVEGLEDETYEIVRPPKVEGLAKEMRELYRQVTKGTKDKVNRLMKDPDESPSEDDEESETESESERENCEMLLKTSLRLMLELDTEIRGLLEELEQLGQLLMFKVDEAGPKVLALRAEVEVLKESNYAKEVEVIGMVKGLIDGGAAEEAVIDAVRKIEIGPMVEKAKEKIAQVKSERKEVEEMDRTKSSSDASEN